jgi:hypothetical protein
LFGDDLRNAAPATGCLLCDVVIIIIVLGLTIGMVVHQRILNAMGIVIGNGLADVALFVALGFPLSFKMRAEIAFFLPVGCPSLRWMETREGRLGGKAQQYAFSFFTNNIPIFFFSSRTLTGQKFSTNIN